jgi:hypothetical protein
VSSGESFSLDLGTQTFQSSSFSNLFWFVIVSYFEMKFRLTEGPGFAYWSSPIYSLALPLKGQ